MKLPWRKRLFDLCTTLALVPIWLPVCLFVALALLIANGRPVFYRSRRRVAGGEVQRVVKFRTMVRNAEQVLNRDTVPVTDTAFLNIPIEHPVYTRTGRWVERFALTELPQLLHVLAGRMSLVGNRPLPENVIRALCQRYPYAEDRFLAPGGLTGPVQLIGRDGVTDGQRLAIEIDYCLLTQFRYRWRLDIAVLWYTVAVALKLRAPMGVGDVRAMLDAHARPERPARDAVDRRQSALRFRPPPDTPPLVIRGATFDIVDFGYRGLRLQGRHALEDRLQLRFAWPDPLGALEATVSWQRQIPGGLHEIGVTMTPGSGGARQLIAMVRSAPVEGLAGDVVTPDTAPAL